MDTPIIPGYDILAPLPQGGMSAVFKARQVSLDRVVALKILPPAMAADGVDIEKFLAEAKITAQLKHPNIVQVYDFGKSPDGIYYFVMEFVSGYSVADWVRRKKSLSVKDALLCAHCVAEALGYLDQCLGNGFRPGMGHVIPDRMFWAQPDTDDEGNDEAMPSIEIPPNATRH